MFGDLSVTHVAFDWLIGIVLWKLLNLACWYLGIKEMTD